MRRGLTLIELLLALTLLTGIAAAMLPLTRSVLGGAREIDRKLLWGRSAEMTLGEIDRLLVRKARQDSGESVVLVENERLAIHLVGGSTATLAVENGELRSSVDRQLSRMLIGELGEISFSIDEETDTLTVMLSAISGETVQRTWELSP